MDEDGVGNTTLNQVTHSDKLGCFRFQGERVCYPPFCWACETPCSSIRYMGITASHKEPKGAVQTLVADWSVSSISVCRPGLWWCVSLLRSLPLRIWMKFWLDMPVQCSQCQRQLFFFSPPGCLLCFPGGLFNHNPTFVLTCGDICQSYISVNDPPCLRNHSVWINCAIKAVVPATNQPTTGASRCPPSTQCAKKIIFFSFLFFFCMSKFCFPCFPVPSIDLIWKCPIAFI